MSSAPLQISSVVTSLDHPENQLQAVHSGKQTLSTPLFSPGRVLRSFPLPKSFCSIVSAAITKIVVLDGCTVNPGDLSWDEYATLGDLEVYDRACPDQVVTRARDAQIIVTNKTIINRDAMTALPLLRYIGVIATGYNVVDTQAARQFGILITNVPEYSTATVAQAVFALFLELTNRTGHQAQTVRDGKRSASRDFCYWDFRLAELTGRTLGIVGYAGGSGESGTVFAINTNGSGFINLYTFTGGSDGRVPQAGLFLSGSTLYGTAVGGPYNSGVLFSLNTNGKAFTSLYIFGGQPIDGEDLLAGLILSRKTLYGTTESGGFSGAGEVFAYSLPLLAMTRSGGNVILTWPVNAIGFTLQSATNLIPPAFWSPVFPNPVVVNGQYTITNSTSFTENFYRLCR